MRRSDVKAPRTSITAHDRAVIRYGHGAQVHQRVGQLRLRVQPPSPGGG